jgi:hypothetical protein
MADILEEPCIYVDRYGNEHEIFPMLLKDIGKANRLFSKLLSDECLWLNIPEPKLNRNGKPVIDKKTKEQVLDTTRWDALHELFSLALHEPREELEKWVDVSNGVEILDGYRQISGLKKKILQKMVEETLQHSSPQ